MVRAGYEYEYPTFALGHFFKTVRPASGPGPVTRFPCQTQHLPGNRTPEYSELLFEDSENTLRPLATKQKRRKKKPAKIAKTLYKQHITTDANATGLGEQAARLPGRMATEQLWAFQPKSPKWLPPVPRTKMPPGGLSSAAAVELELERAHALTRLRRKFQDLCKEAGIEVPPKLAFEKWRFAMKWREDMRSTDTAGRDKQSSGNKRKKKKGAAQQQPSDPLIPCLGKDWSCTAVEPGLTADLERAGISEDSAKGVAQSLANESHKAALEVAALKHKLASGRPPMPKSELPILTVHKHSMDLHCRGQFVKLTGSALTKLQLLYQQNLPLADGQHALLEAGQESPQCAFTDRLFALLLRYKTIQGHGFQAAAGPQVFRLLTEQLGVALECFASPLNTFLGRFCSAFPDVDCPFGSQGSFWGFAPSTGSYQVPLATVSLIGCQRDGHPLDGG
ncbi:uncharacterized protein LOC142356883 [Convolutriloba macropyga]|uniref:uncharacterized protein LOC142356883 n=1 Tax=Convolutriloba macropyga TaxID=536237 RepID=UPI003F51EA98